MFRAGWMTFVAVFSFFCLNLGSTPLVWHTEGGLERKALAVAGVVVYYTVGKVKKVMGYEEGQ